MRNRGETALQSLAPSLVYKIADRTAADRARAAAAFPEMPIDAKDGYIHFSTAAQLAETLRLHFAGCSDLRVLAIRVDGLGEGLKWEPSRGGQLFPHYYGALDWAVVASEARVDVAADGSVTLPEWVR